jgi:ATP-binding cassette subfamily B protein
MIAAALHQTIQVAVNSTMATSTAYVVTEQYLWLKQFSASERERAAGRRSPVALRQGIRLEGVGFRYPGTTRPALSDIDIVLPAGKVVAIVGEYGSGKSTLVKLLAKLYLPSSGRITVDGADLSEIDTGDWRVHLSAAFQDFGRFNLTVQESIGLGSLDELHDRERIRQALEAADGADMLETLPAGLETQLGHGLGGVELSEGQWQRVALARASMRRSPVLFLLDEPTATLDALAEREIFERYMARARDIGARAGGVTVIVSHRFSTVSSADLILVLDQGRLVETGSHRDLLARQGRYAAQYRLQADAYLDHRVG